MGRIVGDKGINELVEAFEKLHQKYTRTQLVLIGEYEANLDPLKQETVKRIDKNFAIRMVGAKRGEDLLTYYAAADCLVFLVIEKVFLMLYWKRELWGFLL